MWWIIGGVVIAGLLILGVYLSKKKQKDSTDDIYPMW